MAKDRGGQAGDTVQDAEDHTRQPGMAQGAGHHPANRLVLEDHLIMAVPPAQVQAERPLPSGLLRDRR